MRLSGPQARPSLVDVGVAVIGPVGGGVMDLACRRRPTVQPGLVQPPSRAMSMIRWAGEAIRRARNRSIADPVALSNTARKWLACAGEADDVGDRHDGAAAGDADPGAGLQVLQGGADDDRHRQPVELTQLAAHQGDPPDRDRTRRGGVGPGCGGRCRSGLGWVCPEVQGSGSAGLHMPGAAYLAKIASQVAHASGVRCPVIATHAVAALLAHG